MLNYDLCHSLNINKVTNADFRMFKECDLACKTLKINNVTLKVDKVSELVVPNQVDYENKIKAFLNVKRKFLEPESVKKLVIYQNLLITKLFLNLVYHSEEYKRNSYL